MKTLRQGTLALIVAVLVLLISQLQITVTDEDCRFLEDESGEPVTGCTEAEIAFALSTGSLTAEQCQWMHEQGITWEIHLEQ